MTTCYRRLQIPALVFTIIALTLGLVPGFTDAQTPQGNSGGGSVPDIAPNNGVFAVLSGTRVKFSDGLQILGEVELETGGVKFKGARVLQPSNTRTYVICEDGSFFVIDSSTLQNPKIVGGIGFGWPPVRGKDKITGFTQYNDTTFVACTREGNLITYSTSTVPVSSRVQAGMGTSLDSKGGKLFIMDNGNLHELTPDVSGGFNKGPATNTGAGKKVALNNAGTTAVTVGGNEAKVWDVSGGTPAELASQSISGTFQAVSAGADDTWWMVFDEFGSPKCEKWSLNCTPACAFTVDSELYLRWLGSDAVVNPDPTDASVAAVSKGDGGQVLQSGAPQLAELFTLRGLLIIRDFLLMNLLGNPRLYAAGDVSGMWFWDMTNPALPVFIDLYTAGFDPFAAIFSYAPPGAAHGAAAGPYIVAAVAGGFTMLDLMDPDSPAFTDRRFTGSVMNDLAVSGDRAYGANDVQGLKIADLTNVLDMVIVRTVATPSAATRVELNSSHAYVGTVSDGVRIVDVSVDTLATEVGSIPITGPVDCMTSNGTTLYVGSDSTLSVWDLTTPSAPTPVTSYTLSGGATVADIGIVDVPPGAAWALSAATQLAYVAAGRAGYVILDVSNPATPSELFRKRTSDFASALAVDGSDVYLADGGAGFIVYEVDPGSVPVFIHSFRASTDGRSVDIAWEFSADEDILGLEILRSEGNDRPAGIHGDGLLPSGLRSYHDASVQAGHTYEYTMVVKTLSGDEFRSAVSHVRVPGRQTALLPNYPNPFNPSTTIAFDLPEAAHVTLAIYDAAGRYVVTLADGRAPAGLNEVAWDGTNAKGNQVGSGIYVARLQTGNHVRTIKLTLVK